MAFWALGFAGAGWTSRIPQLRQLLHLPTAEVGLLLAAVALGGAVAIPAAGAVVSRLGSARTVGLAAMAFAAALLSIAVGVLGQAPALVGGLLVMGGATAVWDVAIAVQVGAIEHRLARPVLASCFGAFSAGAILGAAISVVLIALGVPPGVQFASTALLIGLGAAIVPRWLLPEAAVPWRSRGRRRTRVRWREGARLLSASSGWPSRWQNEPAAGGSASTSPSDFTPRLARRREHTDSSPGLSLLLD